MTDIKPKPEHFKDPYVIQLIGTIALLEDRIEDLEEGACRFNCRKQKDAFMAGWRYRAVNTDRRRKVTYTIDEAYKEWKHEQG